ncbi:hypothetical protein DFP92_11032 [Yoonia sediminilitoris]|uniref:Uncharacterized protein n=1 Tax=Yoonia sediminilitoris TaxID=1286148 RepID=A0A2T6KBY1_9RHOB|nr:hypothetical protein C8N45_11032 [Yoonia sediminilitoris]RCW93087.1 hypothetical protein DFP92_11032 [Yoonia sediminilitoris]
MVDTRSTMKPTHGPSPNHGSILQKKLVRFRAKETYPEANIGAEILPADFGTTAEYFD